MLYLERTIATWLHSSATMWKHKPDILIFFKREARGLDFYLNVLNFQMLANKIGLEIRCGPRATTL